MTKPKSTLHERYKDYEIRHRPWLKRRPWRCQVPNIEGRTLWCDVASVEAAHNLIDRGLLQIRLSKKYGR